MPSRPRATDRFLTTVLMTDIVRSTEHAAELGDRGWRDLVQLHHELVRGALRRHAGREVDTAGDGFFAVFDAPAAAVECATEIVGRVKELGIEIRAGVHVGEVEQVAGKVGGLSVPIAARITGLAGPGEVLVSSTVRDLSAGAGLRFEDRGVHQLKGVPGEWRVYAAVPAAAVAPATAATAAEPELAHRRAAAVRRARSRPIWQRRPRLVAATAIALAAILATSGLLVWKPWQPPALASIEEDAIGVIDVTRGEIVASVKVGAQPGAVAIGEGFAWLVNTGSDTVARIDLATRTVTREIDVGRTPTGITVAGGSIWVANSGERTVTRINADTARVVDTIEVGNGPAALAAGDDAVWVAITRDSTLVRIDAASGTPGEPIPVGAGPVALAADASGLWVASADVAAVTRLDPRTGVTPSPPIQLPARPVGIAIAGGSVWVAADDGTLTRIDPATNRVTATVDVGGSPSGIVADETTLWIADRQGSVSRLDLDDPSAPLRRIATTSAPEALATVSGEVWVTTRASPAAHRGGTLRVLLVRFNPDGETTFDGLDPAVPIPYNAAMLQADGLVGYRRVGGVAGSTLLPNLATAVPEPTEGGRVYAFQLRPDLVYSDGRSVRASDFRRAIERSFQVGWQGFAVGNLFYRSIDGAEGCSTPDFAPVERCDLSDGIEADDESGALIFRLSQPDPDFLAKLALSPAYPIPDGVPMTARVDGTIPGTGPYVVAEVTGDLVRFTRNERFRVWNAAVRPDGFPDEIVYQFVPPDTPPEERVSLIGSGEADYMPLRGPIRLPPELMVQVSRQYAGQVHFGPAQLTTIVTDATRPPFDSQEVRQAVSLALDRGALTQLYGGPPAVGVTCQFLPPGWPGYQPYCPFTADPDAGGRWHAPDLAAARRLVEASGTSGAEVMIGPSRASHAQTRDELARVLEELGYQVTVDREVDDAYVSAALREGRIQIGVFDVVPDVLAPSTYFREFTCSTLAPIGVACDDAYDALFEEALALQATDAAAAAAKWAQVERAAVDRALWIPLFNSGGDFVSERLGNVQFHPLLFVLLDQLWVE
jgi:peptide/nickel transport system substrate-binding protein